MKSSKVSIKTRSTPASLSFKGQATKLTAVKWSVSSARVVQYCDIMRFMILCVRHHKVSPNPNP